MYYYYLFCFCLPLGYIFDKPQLAKSQNFCYYPMCVCLGFLFAQPKHKQKLLSIARSDKKTLKERDGTSLMVPGAN